MLDVIESTMDRLDASKAWRPDPQCLVASDEYAQRALCGYAAAGLNNAEIARRFLDIADDLTGTSRRHDDAAVAVARHCALAGMSFRSIIDVLVYLAVSVPGWPDDPDAIESLARRAIAEAGA